MDSGIWLAVAVEDLDRTVADVNDACSKHT